MALVIYSETDGVYLGTCLGLAFWSNLDPVGQDSAVAFDDAQEAEAHLATWEGGRPNGIRFVEVDIDADGRAPMLACVRAGLPGWLHERTPVANEIPA